jgi:hypothetical protein
MSRLGLTSKIADNIRLAETQSDKLAILQRYKKESLVKRIIAFGYNPMLDFGMQDWNPTAHGKEHGMGISKFMHIIEDIIAKKLNLQEAKFAAGMALNHINDDEADIFIGILKNNLDWGLEPETINAVWPDITTSYPIQRPSEFSKSIFSNFNMPVVVQKMSKGLRINIIVDGESVQFKTSTGMSVSSLDQYAPQFKELAQRNFTVFDGHAVMVDEKLEIVDATDEEILNADPDYVKFVLWDAVRGDGFLEGKDTRIGYNWRFNGLEHMMFLAIESNPDPVYTVVQGDSLGSLEEVYNFVRENNCDVVIKNLSGTWRNGQTTEELILPRSSV